MSIDRPDNDSLFTLIGEASETIHRAADKAAGSTGEAWTEHADHSAHAIRDAASGTSSAVAAHGERLAVTFTDIDPAVSGLRAVNSDVGPIPTSVAVLPGHPDLLASAILSSATAVAVTAAAFSASARISSALITSEVLTLVAATVVSSYQLVDAALSTQITALDGVARTALATLGDGLTVTGTALAGAANVLGTSIAESANLTWQGGTALFTLTELTKAVALTALGSALVGFGTEAVTSFTEPLPNLFDGTDQAELLTFFVPLTRFNLGDAWANSGTALQTAFGATGPLFDDILDTLIRSGRTVGLLHDGETQLVDEAPIDPETLAKRMSEARTDSEIALDRELALDASGAILPRDVAELAASAGQVDRLGGTDFSAIRVITSIDSSGQTSYLVVIPGTQQWWPINGPAANDLTADLYNLAYGGSELSDTVLEAVGEAHGADGIALGAAPVTYTGFSLGGITAGTLAANPAANAGQVVTFGAPYANAEIPAHVGVIAYEAGPDIVPTLDGANNPDRWTTIRDNAPAIEAPAPDGDGGTVSVGGQDPSTHDANRYAAMAADHPTSSATLDDFFKGTITVHDYYAIRR